MNDKIKTLARYRLEKAKEDLETAKMNIENGFYKAAINRSYYAIFHAIRAVNALDEFDSKKHSGVIAHFNQFYIHTDKFIREVYDIITAAYKIREKSDYDDFYIAIKEDAQEQIINAEKFLGVVVEFIEKNIVV